MVRYTLLASGATWYRLRLVAQYRAVEAQNAHAQRRHRGRSLVGDDIDRDVAVLLVRRNQHRRVEAAGVVVQGLPASVVVEARPRGHRPAVVELPVDGAHGARAIAPQMLGPDLDAFGLQHLAGVKERGEVLGLGIVAQHVVADDGVAGRVLLVRQHDRSEDVDAVFRNGEGLDRAHFGERLEAVLGHEARVVLLVVGEGNAAVPHRPVVHVAGLVLVGKFFVVGAGRAGPVGGFGRQTVDRRSQDAAEGGNVVLPHLEADVGRQLVAVFPGERDLGLVVAAPDDDAGMVAQAANLLLRLRG